MAVTFLATEEVAKELNRIGRAGGLPQDTHDKLVRKLSDPAGKIEPKGRGFYGIDLGAGKRTLFTLDEQKRPVLIFIGDHAAYDRISDDITDNHEETKKKYRAKAAVAVTLSSAKADAEISLEQFSAAFAASAGLTEIRINAPGGTAGYDQEREIDRILGRPEEKLAALDPRTGERYICLPDSNCLVTISRDGKKSLSYEDPLDAFAAHEARIGRFHVLSTPGETRAFAAASLSDLRLSFTAATTPAPVAPEEPGKAPHLRSSNHPAP